VPEKSGNGSATLTTGAEAGQADPTRAVATTVRSPDGVAGAARIRKEVLGAVNCTGGKLTCPPVGEAHGIPVVDAAEALG